MSAFSEAALQLAPENGADWLKPINERGRRRWQATPFPTRKSENWKYTSLRPLEEGDYLNRPDAVDDERLRARIDAPGLEGGRVVFVNGMFSEALSTVDWPEGVEMVRLAEADAEQQQRIAERLGSVVDGDNHPFAALNESWLSDGVYLRVARNVQVAEPVQVVYLTTAQERKFAVHQRLLVHLESGAEASVLERFVSSEETQNSFTNGITEMQVDDNARLTHYRVHCEQENALHIGGVHVNLERDAVLDSFQVGMGSTLQRIDVVVNHNGSGADCRLNGIYLPHNRQLVDFHTCIEHRVPNCRTKEVFRGIVGDHAKAVFNGRIHIHPDAQKTEAELSNKNLLTSASAEVDTKPELEIYADDVKCAHGATVAQLDEGSVYYLTSRGIDRDEAVMMLSFGFINELLQEVRHDAVRELLEPLLARSFSEEFHLERDTA